MRHAGWHGRVYVHDHELRNNTRRGKQRGRRLEEAGITKNLLGATKENFPTQSPGLPKPGIHPICAARSNGVIRAIRKVSRHRAIWRMAIEQCAYELRIGKRPFDPDRLGDALGLPACGRGSSALRLKIRGW